MIDGTLEKHSIPLFIATGPDAPRPELPFVERNAINVVIRNPKTGKYLGLRWKNVNWETFISGGIEEGQSAEEAARAEVLQETGYKNLRLVANLPRFDAKFYHAPKGENRYAHVQPFLFELIDEEREPISAEEDAIHEVIWLDHDQLKQFRLPEGHRFILDNVPA